MGIFLTLAYIHIVVIIEKEDHDLRYALYVITCDRPITYQLSSDYSLLEGPCITSRS